MHNLRYSFFILGAALFGLVLAPAFAQNKGRVTISPDNKLAGEEYITSAVVLSRVEVLRDELELLRREIGEPPPVRLDISVRNAAPRETYFHAYTLSDKAHQLAFEFTGRPEKPLGILLAAETTPVHVYAVVSEALESILTTKRALGIEEATTEVSFEPTLPSSEVLGSIIRANRELNNLLYQAYSPLDTYEQVSMSINFAARLLEQFPGSTPVPAAPPFERRKTAAEVFYRLVNLFEHVRDIALASGETMLELTVRSSPPTSITPSDVHDIARMMFAELAYFYSLLRDPKSVDEPNYPSYRVLPSHVFQLVGVLESQLEQLQTYTAANPGWLRQN